MPVDDPNELERIDREIRINELKHQAEDLAGGEFTSMDGDDCPPEVAEQFWQNIVDYERAPLTTHFDQLAGSGFELPPPDALSDEALSARLWALIRRRAERRVFLSRTDHLSDRELYSHLYFDALREERSRLQVRVIDEVLDGHL